MKRCSRTVLTKLLLAIVLHVVFMSTRSFALPITFSFSGTITTGGPATPAFPAINVGSAFVGQFKIDNLTVFQGNSGVFFYPQSSPWSLSVDSYQLYMPLATLNFVPESDLILLFGHVVEQTIDGVFRDYSPGGISLNFHFPAGSVSSGIFDWGAATLTSLDWESPIGVRVMGTVNSLTPVPEPSTLLLLATGLAVLLGLKLRKRTPSANK